MAMVVKNNMSAVRTLNTLNSNTTALQKSLQKVSSGMKINSAQDDASGYAISERMRVRIRSLDQANQNSQNDASLMKTAEGAVGNTVEILRALKEKAINAANDSNTDEDRATIQKELNQFIDQIDDNALVQFNGKYLIDGSKNNASNATKTILLNQSLKTDTALDSKLTDLKNRAGDSLGIQDTDKYQVSWVRNGKTEFTSGNVASITDLKALLNIADDTLQVATDSTGLIAEAAAIEVETDPTTYILAADTANYKSAGTVPDPNPNDYEATVDLDTPIATAGYVDNDSYKTAAATAIETAAGKIWAAVSDFGLTDASGTAYNEDSFKAALAADGSTGITGTVYFEQQVDDPTLTDDSGNPVKVNKEATASVTIGTATVAAETDMTDPMNPKVTGAKATFKLTISSNVDGSYKPDGSTDTPVTAGDDLTAGTALYKKVAPAAGGNGNPIDAPDKFGNAVYTPDKTAGVAIASKEPGVDEQLAGFTVSILDRDGNVKKAANAALDQFKQYQRAENNSGDMSLNFHIGSEANVAIKVGMTDMRSQALGLKGADGERIKVTTKELANSAINVIENALTKALDQQTTIGAIEARLEYTSTNLTTSSENVQAAESTIRDADMAKEMTNYTKSNVLLQAAQAMLAQANQNSSAVLSLLQ